MLGAWHIPQHEKSSARFPAITDFMFRLVSPGFERASLVAQMVKNEPAMQENWVRSLGREDLLEKGMGTHSSVLA